MDFELEIKFRIFLNEVTHQIVVTKNNKILEKFSLILDSIRFTDLRPGPPPKYHFLKSKKLHSAVEKLFLRVV